MAAISVTFSGCEDFECRGILPGLDDGAGIYVCWVDGLADGTAISEDILRPLTEKLQDRRPQRKSSFWSCWERRSLFQYRPPPHRAM